MERDRETERYIETERHRDRADNKNPKINYFDKEIKSDLFYIKVQFVVVVFFLDANQKNTYVALMLKNKKKSFLSLDLKKKENKFDN